MDAGGAGEVAGGAVFGGDGEDIAAGAEDGAGAVGGDVEGGGVAGDVEEAAAADGEVLVDLDGDAFDAFGGRPRPGCSTGRSPSATARLRTRT